MDPRNLKQIVGILWLLDTVCIALTMHASYSYTVMNHARPLQLLDIVWSLRIIVFLTALLAFITHLFLAYRIHKLSGHNIWLSVSIASTTFIRMGFSIATMSFGFIVPSFPKFLASHHSIIATTVGSCAVSDFALSTGLVYFLHTSDKGFTSSDTFFDKVLVYLVNAGLLRSVLALVSLICILKLKSNLVFMGFYFIFSKMYTNSFMAILNARRNTYVPSQIGSFDLGQDFEGVLSDERGINRRGILAIHITQEYHTTIDQGRDFLELEQMPAARTSTFKSVSEEHTSNGS